MKTNNLTESQFSLPTTNIPQAAQIARLIKKADKRIHNTSYTQPNMVFSGSPYNIGPANQGLIGFSTNSQGYGKSGRLTADDTASQSQQMGPIGKPIESKFIDKNISQTIERI